MFNLQQVSTVSKQITICQLRLTFLDSPVAPCLVYQTDLHLSNPHLDFLSFVNLTIFPIPFWIQIVLHPMGTCIYPQHAHVLFAWIVATAIM